MQTQLTQGGREEIPQNYLDAFRNNGYNCVPLRFLREMMPVIHNSSNIEVGAFFIEGYHADKKYLKDHDVSEAAHGALEICRSNNIPLLNLTSLINVTQESLNAQARLMSSNHRMLTKLLSIRETQN